MRYDTVIIGSGLGGLACGVLLSKAGRRVLVLEQGAQAGGCLQSYRRRGLAFDTGFHYVGGLAEGQSLHSAFRCLGLLDLPWQRLDADGFDVVTIGGETFSLAEGFDAFVNKLAERFPGERQGLEDYAERLRASIDSQWDALRPDTAVSDSRTSEVETSAWHYLRATFHEPLLIDILSATCLRMELRKESLPLFNFLHANGSFVESSWRLRGDGNLIVNRLTEQIRHAGGDVVCHAKVVRLTGDVRIQRAVCEDGREVEAEMFISDIHPALTCDLLKDSGLLRRSYIQRMQRAENTFGMFTVSLLFDEGVMPYLNHNHYIYRHPDVWDFHERQSTEAGGIMVSWRVPEDGSALARQVDLLTPLTRTAVGQWENTAVGRRGDEYRLFKEHLADSMIALAAEQIPKLRSYRERYTSSPLTWRDYTLAPRGSAYGMRKDCRQSATALLSPRTPIANLMLTGQNLMVHGIQGTTMTALHTCAEILGRQTVWGMLQTKE